MRRETASRGAYPGAVRIIGGKWRGRRIPVPRRQQLRPTPDRVRETLFNWLAPFIEGAHCLDLFAGVGVLGLEALSREADRVVFVDRDAQLAQAIRALLREFDATLPSDAVRVVADPAERFLQQWSGNPFDIVFLDPPYEQSLTAVLEQLRRSLAPQALIYAERPKAVGLPAIGWAKWIRRAHAGDIAYGMARVRGPIDDVL